jgi:hypothetical protein
VLSQLLTELDGVNVRTLYGIYVICYLGLMYCFFDMDPLVIEFETSGRDRRDKSS